MDHSFLDFVAQLKKIGIDRKIPNVSETVGRFLNLSVKISRPKRILEIGCANGYSTLWLCEAARLIGATITTIDASAPALAEAQQNIAAAGFADLVDFRFGKGETLLPTLEKEHFDFVFLDSEKKRYGQFLGFIEPLLTKNAIVVVDDVLKFPEKTRDFWLEIEQNDRFERVMLPLDPDDGVMLLRKIA